MLRACACTEEEFAAVYTVVISPPNRMPQAKQQGRRNHTRPKLAAWPYGCTPATLQPSSNGEVLVRTRSPVRFILPYKT